jgi:choline-sulfatase
MQPDAPVYDCVVMVSLDTLRSDGIGANPYQLWPSKYQTQATLRPSALDHLVGSSAFFPNCISAAPYTSAAHGAILSGKWPVRNGLYGLFNQRLRARTVFSRARGLGFHTVMKVDFPLVLGERLGFVADIDEYHVEDDEAFLASVEREPRFVGLAHFGGMHMPYGFHNLRFGGQAYVDKVAQLEIGLGQTREPAHEETSDASSDDRPSASSDMDLMIRYRRAVERLYAEGRYRELFDLYLEGVNHFLRTRFTPFLNNLLNRLSGRSWLLILFGDHGEEYDEHSYGHQNSVAEGVLRVPLVVAGPGVVPGLHSTRVRSVDVAPTVLEAIGDRGRGRLKLDGVSLGGTIWGGQPALSRTAFAQAYIPESGDFGKYLRQAVGGRGPRVRHLLYREAVYEGRYRLTRQHLDEPAEEEGDPFLIRAVPTVSLEVQDEHLSFHEVDDSAAISSLSALLDSFGAVHGADRVTPDAEDDVKAQLRAMGYRL